MWTDVDAWPALGTAPAAVKPHQGSMRGPQPWPYSQARSPWFGGHEPSAISLDVQNEPC